ncbi:MAG: hypothetical protein JXR91_12170 [Deltaproteobacteria bacterium]|nr:hypothetical protein [Deltaproteobacteria bacterium]
MSKQDKKSNTTGLILAIAGALLIAGGILTIPEFAKKMSSHKGDGHSRDVNSLNKIKSRGSDSHKKNHDKIKRTLSSAQEAVNKEAETKSASVTAPVTQDSDAGQTPAQEAATSGEMKWTFTLEKKYQMSDSDLEAIKAIADILLKNSELVIKATGINNSNKSSKRALFGADVVVSKIREIVKIKDSRIVEDVAQTPEAEGLKVTIELIKEVR